MARDNEHKIYKEKWACFACRKCFKQRSWLDLLADRGFATGKSHLVKRDILCPQCRRPMTNMGWDFKVPKQKDVEQWKKVELLAQNGYTFHSRCWWGEPHKGPGPRPARLRDVEPFLKEERRKAGEEQQME
jgi:hypothetical protein